MVKYLGFAEPAQSITPYAPPNQNYSCVLFPAPDTKGGLQPVLNRLLNADKTTMANDIINQLLAIFDEYETKLFDLHTKGKLTEYGSQEEFLAAITKGKAILQNLKPLWGQTQDGPNADFSYDGESGLDLFNLIQTWRSDNQCNTLFFNKIFNFECPVAVRGMLEGDSPVTQCRNLYRDAGGDDGQLSAEPRTGLSGEQKNPDGLAKGRNPIWWCIEKDGVKTWLRPTTCYICETYLYDTNFEDNDMQCEHFFPFLEAQLLWSLKIPSKIGFADPDSRALANRLLNREYGPVCRLCNCNPHKGGKNILRFNADNITGRNRDGSFEINPDTIEAIVNNSNKSGRWPVGRPKPKTRDATFQARILNEQKRRERFDAVFLSLIHI